jgi:hypothetical protein
MGNGQAQLDVLDKQLSALEMRKGGKTYAYIADQLGYKTSAGAYRAVMTALKKTLQEPSDEVRTLELERLDDLIDALWEKRKQPQYTDRILRIMERRAKLLGLDAPTRTDVTSAGQPIKQDDNERFDRAISTLADAVRKSLPGQGDAADGEMDATE